MSAPQILVVDDDPHLCGLLTDYFSENGFRVLTAGSLSDGRLTVQQHPLDMIILDLHFPDGDGIDLAREIRTRSLVPLIMLSVRNSDSDRVLGLEVGADDYVGKPFSPRELLARVHAVRRRTTVAAACSAEAPTRPLVPAPRAYRFAGWELDLATRRLTDPSGARVVLTIGEFNLLVAFVRSPQRVLSREQLLAASRIDDDIYDRSVNVQVLRLRRKLEPSFASPRLIATERGHGYLFDAVVASVF